MLTQTQISEIREHLEKAQNPIFFFDNDQDGLCSFLLLQRFIGRGRGIPIRSFPSMDKEYFRRVKELNADYVFILDKPLVAKGFFEEVEKENIPVVWIDHHQIDKSEIPESVYYYNPLFSEDKSSEPVTYLSYLITKKESDKWIALVGCISDKFLPDFFPDVKKEFPELLNNKKSPFEIFYESDFGKIARIFGFGLKDKTTNVINMLRFLMKVKSPFDVLEESPKNKTMHEHFEYVFSKYQKFFQKAIALEEENKEKILFFQYGGDMSISSDLSNELNFRFPNKIIVVVYISGVKANISVRGKKIKELVVKSIAGLENATGGGHEDAVGATVRIDDLEQFKKNLTELLE
ncbi:hypothetical protein J4474_04970 [Candidatus Pacearchaeota archaeon]|nr:hypothetical protein [Candidatus Pacearchaeota archaeon]